MRRILRVMVRLTSTVSVLALLLAACAGDVRTGALRGTSPEGGYAALLRVADATRANGDLPTAAGMYRRAAELRPDLAEPHLRLGQTLNDLNAWNEAVPVLRQALTLDAGNADARRGLGNAFLSMGQPDLALPQFETALRTATKDARLHGSLGVAHDLLGDHAAAQAAYRAGLALTPDSTGLANNLGLSLALAGDFPAAVEVLRPLGNSGARARQNLALVYGLSGDATQAARVARIDLDESAVRSNLAYYETLRAMGGRQRLAAIRARGVLPRNGEPIVE